MENFAEAKFLNTDNPPVSLRLTAPFTQGGLVAGNNSFTDPDNLLAPVPLHKGPDDTMQQMHIYSL